MSEEFKVEIVNPEKSFLVKDDVSEVVLFAFGNLGSLGFYQNQVMKITMLKMVLLSSKITIYLF